MHFYWRVIEELKYLNEIWRMADPSLARCFAQWIKRNADTLALAEQEDGSGKNGLILYNGAPTSLN